MARFLNKLLEAQRLLSFDDVYLVPRKAPTEPSNVDLTTRFSRSIQLRIPIASAPMDTVSEADMAIAMAMLGGIGVVHRNCSIDEQVEMVMKVKTAPPIPLTLFYAYIDEPCQRVIEYMKDQSLREIPVVDYTHRVRGYVRYGDLVSECREDPTKPVELFIKSGDIYTVDRADKARKIIVEGLRDVIAIVDHSGRYLGTMTVREALEEYQPVLDEDGRLRVAAAISPFDRARALKLDRFVDALVCDVAHFHNVNVLQASRNLVKELKSDFVAGNIGTYEAAVDCIATIDRIDAFRVGIGGGSICTTPDVGGVYAPTLWAVAAVRDAIEDHGLDIPVIADGGIRTPGDAVKALAAGASSVMLGYVLAGTDEASAPIIAVGEKLYKPYRGMASRGAMARRFSIDRYSRASKRVAEGVEGLVPYKGSVKRVVREFVEGIRAGLGYAGARNIRELWEVARFGLCPRKRIPRELLSIDQR